MNHFHFAISKLGPLPTASKVLTEGKGPSTDSPRSGMVQPKNSIAEAASHLRVALLQSHPDDDQIILEHVREALKLLEEK